MKKVFSIVLCLFTIVILTGCINDGKVKEIEFDIKVSSSAGQRIIVEIKDEDIISVDSSTDTDDKTKGGEETIHYTIKGKKKGETQVSFVKVNRHDKTIEKIVYTIKVDSNLKMTESHIRV